MKTRFPLLTCLLVAGLVMVTAIQAADVEISVDAGKAGAAISPYVYGQFIEHLGRCIHDGIWAEKLLDRKFLQEPGKNWQTVKPAGAAGRRLPRHGGRLRRPPTRWRSGSAMPVADAVASARTGSAWSRGRSTWAMLCFDNVTARPLSNPPGLG